MRDYGFSPAQQDEIWRRRREGQSFSLIGRALGAPMQNARRFLHQSGGVRLTPQQRSERYLSGSEREEISRGIAAAGELQRDLQRELTYDGLRAAEAKGNKGGRCPVVTTAEVAAVRAAYLDGQSIASLAREHGPIGRKRATGSERQPGPRSALRLASNAGGQGAGRYAACAPWSDQGMWLSGGDSGAWRSSDIAGE